MSAAEAIAHWRAGAQEALTPFSSEARYDDVGWVNEQATTEFVKQWLQQSRAFLSRLHCGLDA